MTDEKRDPVVEAVRADLLQRSQVGIAKYGVMLNRTDLNLRDWLQHAYEETLDQANYLKRAIIEIDQQEQDEETMMALIDKLRFPEGNSVTLVCDNPDFNGQPNAVVEIVAEFTGWETKRFTGDTAIDALKAAVAAMEGAPQPSDIPEQE